MSKAKHTYVKAQHGSDMCGQTQNSAFSPMYPHRHINLRLQPQTKLNFACAPAYITNLPLVQITNEWMNALHVGNISTGRLPNS